MVDRQLRRCRSTASPDRTHVRDTVRTRVATCPSAKVTVRVTEWADGETGHVRVATRCPSNGVEQLGDAAKTTRADSSDVTRTWVLSCPAVTRAVASVTTDGIVTAMVSAAPSAPAVTAGPVAVVTCAATNVGSAPDLAVVALAVAAPARGAHASSEMPMSTDRAIRDSNFSMTPLPQRSCRLSGGGSWQESSIWRNPSFNSQAPGIHS